MKVETTYLVCDGLALKWLFAGGLAWLEHNREQVNALNVFPVPDGDTGTNMLLTLRKAYESVANQDENHVGQVAQAIAKGALHGARGNSGVILSQLIAGFASIIKAHDVFDIELLDAAVKSGVEAAYKAVMEPTEGTILTVARETAEALSVYASAHDDLGDALDVMVKAAHRSLIRTPDLLPILKRAGVVDSGGQGFVFMLEGMMRVLQGEPVNLELEPNPHERAWQNPLEPDDEEGYGYDVQFLMHGDQMNVEKIRADIDAMGWSTLVVGDETLIKVHVHVHNPGDPLSYAINSGAAIDDVVVENMQMQYEANMQQRFNAPTADSPALSGPQVITVATGSGFERLLRQDLGAAHVIHGGQTMNPGTNDFVEAIQQINADSFILLPNNKNIILAAQQAATMLPDKIVHVIPTTTLPQGISAMLAYLDHQNAETETLIDAMTQAAKSIISAEITQAVRDAHLDVLDIEAGQYIGLLNGDLVTTADSLESALIDILGKAGGDEYELITIYYGSDLSEAEAVALQKTLENTFSEQNIVLVEGGQSLYPLVISIE